MPLLMRMSTWTGKWVHHGLRWKGTDHGTRRTSANTWVLSVQFEQLDGGDNGFDLDGGSLYLEPLGFLFHGFL